MQHAALCLSGTADVSVQLTPYAAYRDSGAKPRAWSSYEGLKLGSYGEYIAVSQNWYLFDRVCVVLPGRSHGPGLAWGWTFPIVSRARPFALYDEFTSRRLTELARSRSPTDRVLCPTARVGSSEMSLCVCVCVCVCAIPGVA